MHIFVCVFVIMFFLGNSRKITLTSQPIHVDRTQYPCIFVKESVLRYIKPHEVREVLHHCNTLQHKAAHCSTLQHTTTPATHCNYTHCSILAAHCKSLQHTATHIQQPHLIEVPNKWLGAHTNMYPIQHIVCICTYVYGYMSYI